VRKVQREVQVSKSTQGEHLELDSNQIHISNEDGNWWVWLNTDVGDFDGLCIGCGQSRKEAIDDAIGVFDQGLRKLKDAYNDTNATPATSGE